MSDPHWLVLFYNRRHHPVIIRAARERFGAKVTAVTIDLGEIRALDAIRAESLAAGAAEVLHVDARAEYCDEFLSRAIKANAVYQDKYLLSAALARPLLGRKLVEIAQKVGAGTVVHGFRGNDQVRVDMAVSALSDLQIIAPLRSFQLTEEEITRYAEEHDIPDEPGTGNPYSVSDNVWGKSTECGPLEDTWAEPRPEIYTYVTPPDRTPDEAATVTLGFEQGVPVSVDGERGGLLDVLLRMNDLGKKHGVGVVDMVEDGMVGMKSRAIYENPGGLCLLVAHRDLERYISGRHENRFKPLLDVKWAEMVYDGLWFDPLMEHMNAFIDSMSRRVSGEVKLRLYKGSITVVGRRSEQTLYRGDESIYHFGHDFGASDAEAFGRVHNLHTRAAVRRQTRQKA